MRDTAPMPTPPQDHLRLFSGDEGGDALRRDERRYRSLVQATTTMVWLADADGRLMSDIPEWREFTGQAPEELEGFGWLDGIHRDDRARADRTWREALEQRSLYRVDYRIQRPDGETRTLEVRGSPVVEPSGELVEWIGTCKDVTEERAAEAAQRDLQARLADERATLERVITQAPSAIAVLWGPDHTFRFFNDRYLELVPAGRVRVGATVRETLPEAEVAVPLLDRAYAGEEVRFEELPVPFRDERSIDGFRYYDVLYAPIFKDGAPAGVSVTASETTEQVRVRTNLQERLRRERDLAERLQRSLLPESLPEVAGLDLAVRYLPGGPDVSVGGDWYDIVELPGDRVLLVIGDVGGHGLEAATVMGQLRAALRAYALEGLAPAAILDRIAAYAQRLRLADMVTIGVGVLDLATGDLEYASGGHLPPLLCVDDGDPFFLDVVRDPPVTTGPGGYAQASARLDRGDMLVLYTDGLVEERDRSLGATLEELRDAVSCRAPTAVEVSDALTGALLDGVTRDDDVALLVCRVRELRGAARPDDPVAAAAVAG